MAGQSSLVGFLNAPLIGLEPFVRGPLYSQAIDHYWHAFEHADRVAPFWIQRTLTQDFRNTLAREGGATAHVVDDPREVPEALRSERWAALCRAIDTWNELSARRQARLAALLHALCFHGLTQKLTSQRAARLDDADDVLLAYWSASAGYMVNLPQSVNDYSFADMTAFERIARDGRGHAAMRFLASVKLLVHEAKTAGRLDALRAAATRAEGLLAAAVQTRALLRHLYTSHFHRAVAMVSQAGGRSPDVTRHMDEAERHARAIRPRTTPDRILCRENLHPVLESRTKEAIWRREPERAVQLARAVVSVDPYDPKSWLELGEALALTDRLDDAACAYLSASVLGPPGSVIGVHMAGVCLERAGKPSMGYVLFLESVARDPLGRASIAHALAVARSAPLPFRAGTDDWLRRMIRLD